MGVNGGVICTVEGSGTGCWSRIGIIAGADVAPADTFVDTWRADERLGGNSSFKFLTVLGIDADGIAIMLLVALDFGAGGGNGVEGAKYTGVSAGYVSTAGSEATGGKSSRAMAGGDAPCEVA